MSDHGITLRVLLSLVLALPLVASGPASFGALSADEYAYNPAVPACSLNALQMTAEARDAEGAGGQTANPKRLTNDANARSSASPSRRIAASKVQVAAEARDAAGAGGQTAKPKRPAGDADARSLAGPSRRIAPSKVLTSGGLRVLGAGLTKTGTSSLHLALRRLGYHGVHGEFLELSTFSDVWTEWEQGDPWPAINKMLAMGFDAASDRPWCFFYQEFLQLNPNMKVILTKFPSGVEGWVRSVEDWTKVVREQDAESKLHRYLGWFNSTVGQHASNSALRTLLNCSIGFPTHGGWSAEQREACAEGYLEWYRRVKAAVSPGQLLEYTVTEGWQPLCTFLNVTDCPQEPFPSEKGPVVMTIKEAVHDALQSMKAAVGLPHERPFLTYDVFAPRQLPNWLTAFRRLLR